MTGIPVNIFVNTLGAGLPVIVLMNVFFLPRIAILLPKDGDGWYGIGLSKMATIVMSGVFYALFSLNDQGVDYSSSGAGFVSICFILLTQSMVGMGKAAFTVVTGNPIVHFITLHIISARVPFDTKMFVAIFGIK